MVCFRYIIVNTVHKGDKKDDNNNNNLIQGGAKVAWHSMLNVLRLVSSDYAKLSNNSRYFYTSLCGSSGSPR